MKKRKILFAPLSLYFSHISRCLSIATVLKANYHIEFIACKKYKHFIENEGYKVHPVRSGNEFKQSIFGADPYYQEQSSNLIENKNYNYQEMILDDYKAIKNSNPDLIIFDGRVTAHLAAVYLKISSVEIRNHVGILNKYELSVIENSGLNKEYEFNLNDIENSYQEIMSAIKILPEIDFIKFLESYTFPPVIIPGVEEFELAENVNLFNNRHYVFVGPLVWNGWKKWDKKIKINNKKKRILITLGSTFPIKNAIDTIINALNSDEYYLIINTGDNFELPKQEKNSNCEIHRYLNIEETIKDADLVIHHGGHGTAMLTLKSGKPCLVIPFNGDHLEVSRVISKLKVGKRIKKYPEEITKTDISNSIGEILNNTFYKNNAEKIAESIKKKEYPAILVKEFIEKQIFNNLN